MTATPMESLMEAIRSPTTDMMTMMVKMAMAMMMMMMMMKRRRGTRTRRRGRRMVIMTANLLRGDPRGSLRKTSGPPSRPPLSISVVESSRCQK